MSLISVKFSVKFRSLISVKFSVKFRSLISVKFSVKFSIVKDSENNPFFI